MIEILLLHGITTLFKYIDDLRYVLYGCPIDDRYFDGGGGGEGVVGGQKIHGGEKEEHDSIWENPCCGYKTLNEPTFLR